MRSPITITFLGLDAPDGVEALIRQRAAMFEPHDDRISSCHVVVDMPHREQRNGSHYAVRIYITTVVGEIAASRDGSRRGLRAVIDDAFAAASGELDDRLQRRPPLSGTCRKAPSAREEVRPGAAVDLPMKGHGR